MGYFCCIFLDIFLPCGTFAPGSVVLLLPLWYFFDAHGTSDAKIENRIIFQNGSFKRRLYHLHAACVSPLVS